MYEGEVCKVVQCVNVYVPTGVTQGRVSACELKNYVYAIKMNDWDDFVKTIPETGIHNRRYYWYLDRYQPQRMHAFYKFKHKCFLVSRDEVIQRRMSPLDHLNPLPWRYEKVDWMNYGVYGLNKKRIMSKQHTASYDLFEFLEINGREKITCASFIYRLLDYPQSYPLSQLKAIPELFNFVMTTAEMAVLACRLLRLFCEGSP